jgi:hypothetical protein
MLDLHSPPHALDAPGIATGLAGAEENRGDGSRGGDPSREHGFGCSHSSYGRIEACFW